MSYQASRLTPKQRALLLHRAQARPERERQEGSIQRRPCPEAPTPLSFAQQRLWFFDRLHPGTATYNVPLLFHLRGPLSPAVLRATFGALIRRHESLRTRFPAVNGEPLQVVAAELEPTLPQVDLSGLASAVRENAVLAICREEAMRPFDLGAGPLLRPLLLRHAAEHHTLLCVFHHIIIDFWSFTIFLREMAVIYEALLQGRRPALPELAIQYPDFAVWQRQSQQGDWLERETAHWRRELAGAPVALALPLDRPRPPLLRHAGSWLPWHLTPKVTEQLRARARDAEATLFMTLLAAFSLLLARYCTQEDLVLGAPVANRGQLELEGLIGFFVNMLVLRADLTGRPSFAELAQRVKQRCVVALGHQNLSFEQLVESLGVSRDLSRQPLVQATLALQTMALPRLESANLRLELAPLEDNLVKFELNFDLTDNGEVLGGSLGYSSELFERTTAQRIGDHFAVLLAGICADPQRPVWELPLLTEAESRQLSWEGRRPAEPAVESVAAQVAAVAGRQATARAAAWQGGEISYGELIGRAGRVAAGLRALGVGPEVVVGVMLERSADLLAGLLGVLMAGGACLLLDPRRDPTWLERTLERSGIAVLLTSEPLRRLLPEHGATEAVIERLTAAAEPLGEVPGRAAPAESLAFVVHTSGSRLAPRRVALEHRGVLAWILHWGERLCADELAGVGPVGALETVDAVFDLLAPLCLGGWVALDAGVPGALWSATPTELATQLQGELPHRSPHAIRSFGERLAAPLAQRLLRTGAGRVHDSYSSAVGGIWEWRDSRRGGEGPEVTPHVLDPAGEPAAIGVPGELWLSGEGLARGYADDPAGTAESFRPDRFSGRSGTRTVRTFDLACWRGDGSLELVGGVERRVQVNGQRLDLGRVEELLAQHPGVLRAIVGVQGDDGAGSLVAHVLAADGDATTTEELYGFLAARLPAPQLPRTLLRVASLPRTPAGRTDRQALPRVEEKPGEYVAPRTETEEVLAAIWHDLLANERIGIEDPFFQLGGHSLLAVRLMSRIESELGVELPVSTLFRAPTIATLAKQIEARSGASRPSVLVSLQPQGTSPPLFFVHPVGGSVLCYRELAGRLGSAQPFFGIEASEEGGGGTLEEMAAGYIAAIRGVRREGPYFLGGWSLGAVVAFEMARQLAQAGEQVPLVAMVDAPPAQPEERRLGPLDGDSWFVQFASDLLASRSAVAPEIEEAVLRWDSQRRLAWLLERAREIGAVPPELTFSQFCRRSQLFLHNLQALARYRAGSLPVDLLFLRSSTPDPGNGSADPTRGWRHLTTGSVACHSLPGTHHSLLRQPHVERLSAILQEGIDSARGGTQ